ncbi:hypothetical protein [Nocardia testacea]|uniref:hypothetical protein n=1 Tax=Nocardia testacea TaxID=248551 RepID=UPI003A870CF7
MSTPEPRPALLSRGSWPEARRIASILRTETAGGILLITAAAIGLIWANTPWSHAPPSAENGAAESATPFSIRKPLRRFGDRLFARQQG